MIRLIDGAVDVFLTSDQKLHYQQNLATISIVLVVPDNRLPTLQPLMPAVQSLLDTITSGTIVEVLLPS